MQKLLDDLNEEQKKAVTFGSGPLLIVAGAGTGKTKVITTRLAWLVLNGRAKTEEILALTFTEKAAQEMEERIDKLLPYGYLDLWVSTFHSFAERLLKNHALEIGLPNDFKLLDETAQWLLIRQNLDKFNLDYYRPLGNPSKFIHALIKHFSRAKDEEVYPEQYLEYAQNLKLNSDTADESTKQEIARTEEVANAYHVYQQILLANNSLDFGDLINYALRLFRQRPHILEQYRKQFKYILVDEFQDTNWAQYQLVKLLAQPKNNLTAVADDDQSIYKFRGACISNILEFKKDYPASQDIVLVKNYRSTQEILDLSYNFIQLNNPNRLECTLTDLRKKLAAQKKEEGEICRLHFATEHEEAEGVVKKIVQLKESDLEVSWNDFAILVRANNQAQAFVQALIGHGLPYQFLASQGLYNKAIVIDILSYLRLLDDYHESPAMYRILNLPFMKFPANDLSELLHYCRKKTLSLYQGLHQAAALPIKPESLKLIQQILGHIDKHSQLARQKRASELIFTFLNDFSFEGESYLKYLSRQENQQAKDSLDFLNQFFKQVKKFELETNQPAVKNFLEFVSLAQEAGDLGGLTPDLDIGPETIKVMTVHGAKGLEFKYVFVVNLVDRRFPTIEKSEAIELPQALIKEKIPEGDIHLQEERRLFYVAMTRAKTGIFFSSADDYGGVKKKKLSRFLIEAGIAKENTSPTDKLRGESSGLPIINVEVSPMAIASRHEKFSFGQMLPAKFSFTQLKAFETCPWQYRFAHLIQIPVMGRYTFSFGKTMHQTLQKFFQKIIDGAAAAQVSLFTKSDAAAQSKKSVPSLKDLLNIYEESWIDEWYPDRKLLEQYKAKGRTILADFYKKHEGAFPVPKFLEKGFNLKVGPYTLKGQIDRVDPMNDGTVEIIDYKTGNVPKEEKLDAGQKEQLLIYQLAAQEVLREKVGRLTFYYLEENKPVSFLGSEEELNRLKERIKETIDQIKKGEFVPSPNARVCSRCDFMSICEYKIL